MARKKLPEFVDNDGDGYLIGYARVSTEQQSLEGQLKALRDYGVKEENIYTDKISGGKFTRRGLNLALKALRRGDTLVVYSLSRIGRSLKYLIQVNEQLLAEGVGLKSLTEPIDTSTAVGKMVFSMQAIFAQYERDVTIERTKLGVAATQAAGAPHGRPRSITDKQMAGIAKDLKNPKLTAAAIGRKHGVAASLIKYHFPGSRMDYLAKPGVPHIAVHFIAKRPHRRHHLVIKRHDQTCLEKMLAKVFRAAADGAYESMHEPIPGGGYSVRMRNPGEPPSQAEIMGSAFASIAEVFEKVAEANRE